ncbi:MAG: DNA-3-methyladenine glycosylase I [Acidobacteria bacterium]|nr:DNA-3-methyladenine glycosylase I [Acidobacteriota bacterium]
MSASNTPHPVQPRRCSWCGDDELYVAYHDNEWGVPVRDDASLFELLTLEGAQAGLSWLTVLRRREGYRRAFENFDADVVARMDRARIEAILGDPGVIRHRQKIDSVVTNARAILALHSRDDCTSFADYVWALGSSDVDGTTSAKIMSKQLSHDGFKFVGPIICLSFMQASGMRNDHAPGCFRFDELEALRPFA